MKMTLKNGTMLETSNPVEQKLFKQLGGTTGWVMNITIHTPMTSVEADALLTPDNISALQLSVPATEEGAEEKEPVIITGYDKVSSLMVRYSKDLSSTVDVQLSKGI